MGANPNSAVRKGLLAAYVANTELLRAEPKPCAAAAGFSVANPAKHGITAELCEAVTQTEPAELATPRKITSGMNHGKALAGPSAEDEELLRKIRVAVRELDATRLRASKAEAAKHAALEALRMRRTEAEAAAAAVGHPLLP